MTEIAHRLAPRQTMTLVGHDAAERAFLDSWKAGRMQHAWLIGGQRGIGKATLAYRIARFVLAAAADGHTDRADGAGPGQQGLAVPASHPVSRQVATGSHPDLLTVERTVNRNSGKLRSEIVVDDVRQASSFLALTTAAGAWRVIVVDAADEMNRNAANALLKRLEEPPPRTLFLLICHRPGQLLPTIQSRCRKLHLAGLSEDGLRDLLSIQAPDLPESDRLAIARLSDGSVGRALTLIDAGGLELYREFVGLLKGLSHLDIRAVQALANKVGRAGSDASFELFGQLVDRWLSRMILGWARGSDAPDVFEGEGGAVEVFRRSGNLAKWLEVWEKLAHLVSRAGSANLERKQVVINVFLALHALVRD
ncbi:MAG: DNA polymerase III subunit delta' [Rhodospirillales bacterium]|nr:MAG: DNA polymerase III subunit delta' [Rhodospirillales bacterium]